MTRISGSSMEYDSSASAFFTIEDVSSAPAHDAFIERKSEFIGEACHVDSLGEAVSFVDAVREGHPKARHTAYAAIVGAALNAANERMSDDGEPSGTAGKPILDVLRANGLTDCVVTVTRYFGGVLLGSGGLIRAYSTAASMALKRARTVEIVPRKTYRVTLEYAWIGKFDQVLADFDGEVLDRDFNARVTMTVSVPSRCVGSFLDSVKDAFSARASLIPVR